MIEMLAMVLRRPHGYIAALPRFDADGHMCGYNPTNENDKTKLRRIIMGAYEKKQAIE